MMIKISAILVLGLAALVQCQRPTYAGSKPIGYPVITTTEGLGDRFGEVDGTTQRLPIEANGDRDLIDRLSKLPIDKQPFWFINWQALEAHREKPQTYPQKPNPFVDPPQTSNFGSFESVSGNSNSGSSGLIKNENIGISGNTNSGSAITNAPNVNRNPEIANRISGSASKSNSANNKAAASNVASNDGSDTLADRFGGGIELNHYV